MVWRCGAGQPFRRMASDRAVALGNIHPFDVRPVAQKDSWCAGIGSLSQHHFVALDKRHFVLVPEWAIEEIESCEDFIQLFRASPMQITPPTIAAGAV